MIGFCTSTRYVEHETGRHHPERPDRIRAVAKAVRQAGMIDSPDPFPELRLDFGFTHPQPFTLRELDPSPADPELAALVHTPRHIDYVRRVCAMGGGVLDQGDTPVCAASYEIALLALGSAIRCADAVMTGEVKRAFSAARPPGHHAEPDRPMGFCLFNNIAIAARHIQRSYSIARVAIVDFDVHHGNGTQASFEDDPSVLFISMHQHPSTCYPGTGHHWERGRGAGEGHTVNIAFNPGCDDADYAAAMQQHVLPALDDFAPEVLLISAGFDGHAEDPLAQMELSENAFEQMTRQLVELAGRHCRGRVVSVLEGGYNLRALGRCVVRHLIGLR